MVLNFERLRRPPQIKITPEYDAPRYDKLRFKIEMEVNPAWMDAKEFKEFIDRLRKTITEWESTFYWRRTCKRLWGTDEPSGGLKF